MGYNNRPSFRERVARFMVGRYGSDELYHFIFAVTFVLIVANLFIGSLIVSILELALIIYASFRLLSRNVYKRRKENEVFLKITKPARNLFGLIKVRFRDRKTHVFRKCPKCKNNLRLPREKGKHTVVCPCCKNRFNVKI